MEILPVEFVDVDYSPPHSLEFCVSLFVSLPSSRTGVRLLSVILDANLQMGDTDAHPSTLAFAYNPNAIVQKGERKRVDFSNVVEQNILLDRCRRSPSSPSSHKKIMGTGLYKGDIGAINRFK